jgi:hypothetical protein
MLAMPKKSEDQYDDREAAARRDAVIKRMIAMPPKPHSAMKIGKSPPQDQVAKKRNAKNKTSAKKKA